MTTDNASAAQHRDPTPLLLLILIALLVQPFAYAWLSPRPEPATAPEADPRLASAIQDLSRAVRTGAPAPAPAVPSRLPSAVTRDEREGQDTGRAELEPLGDPDRDGSAIPAATRTYPRRAERIESWIRQARATKEREPHDNRLLFFYRTPGELLASFGVPDEAEPVAGGVRWSYRSKVSRGRLDLWFHDGRVHKCYFSE